MINAAEANKLTYQTMQTNIAEEMAKIEVKIKGAIKGGKFSIVEDGTLSQEVKNELKRLGYKAENDCQRNESYYTISWDPTVIYRDGKFVECKNFSYGDRNNEFKL